MKHFVYKRISPPTLHRGSRKSKHCKETLSPCLLLQTHFYHQMHPPTGRYNHDIPLFSDIQTNLPFVFHKSGEICLSNHPKLLLLICRNANNTSKAFPPTHLASETSSECQIIPVSPEVCLPLICLFYLLDCDVTLLSTALSTPHSLTL